jgi:hypothetical protein
MDGSCGWGTSEYTGQSRCTCQCSYLKSAIHGVKMPMPHYRLGSGQWEKKTKHKAARQITVRRRTAQHLCPPRAAARPRLRYSRATSSFAATSAQPTTPAIHASGHDQPALMDRLVLRGDVGFNQAPGVARRASLRSSGRQVAPRPTSRAVQTRWWMLLQSGGRVAKQADSVDKSPPPSGPGQRNFGRYVISGC